MALIVDDSRAVLRFASDDDRRWIEWQFDIEIVRQHSDTGDDVFVDLD